MRGAGRLRYAPCRPLDRFLLWLGGPWSVADWLRIRIFERAKLYRWRGVLCYRWLFVRGPFTALNKWIHLRSKKGLSELRRQIYEAKIRRLYRFQSNVGADYFLRF